MDTEIPKDKHFVLGGITGAIGGFIGSITDTFSSAVASVGDLVPFMITF